MHTWMSSMGSSSLQRLLSSSHAAPIIVTVGVVARLALFAVGADVVLQKRPEVFTPLSSWRHLQEGVYLFRQGGDPYRGGVFYHSPIYLYFCAYLLPEDDKLYSALMWVVFDLFGTVSLLQIWKQRSRRHRPERDVINRNAVVVASYFLNPYSIASCVARSSAILDTSLLFTAISLSIQGHTVWAVVLLAIVTHSTVYPALLLVPLLLLSNDTNNPPVKPMIKRHVVFFIAVLLSLGGMFLSQLGHKWILQNLGIIFSVSDLTPNVGMWWYFCTEMFDHFRSFFLGVFQLHNCIYCLPICLRLSNDPLAAILVLTSISTIWKSYPSLLDLSAWGGLLSCFPEVLANLRHPLFTLSVYLHTTILLPLLHGLWVLTGSGNANFFYAATMVYGLNSSLAVVDVLGAIFRTKVKDHIVKKTLAIHPGSAHDTIADKAWPEESWVAAQFTVLLE